MPAFPLASPYVRPRTAIRRVERSAASQSWNPERVTVGAAALSSATPEPATWQLCLIAALLAVPVIVWRRRRA